MAEYLASRIGGGYLEYTFVVSRRPELKEDIDSHLRRLGYGSLIVE